MRDFAEAWPDEQIVQQAVGQLPWGHNLVLLTKLKDREKRLAYARETGALGVCPRRVFDHSVLEIQGFYSHPLR